MESKRTFASLKTDLASNIACVIKRVSEEAKKGDGTSKVWNEIGDVSSAVTLFLEEWKKKRIEESTQRAQEVIDFLTCDKVTQIPFTQEIAFKSQRRMLADKHPNRKNADCFIVDSLVNWFDGKTAGSQLLFCTENTGDFAVKSSHDAWVFHPRMKEGLPSTELFTDLSSMMIFISEKSPVIQPEDDELEEAVQRDDENKVQEEIKRNEILENAACEMLSAARSRDCVSNAEFAVLKEVARAARMHELYAGIAAARIHESNAGMAAARIHESNAGTAAARIHELNAVMAAERMHDSNAGIASAREAERTKILETSFDTAVKIAPMNDVNPAGESMK